MSSPPFSPQNLARFPSSPPSMVEIQVEAETPQSPSLPVLPDPHHDVEPQPTTTTKGHDSPSDDDEEEEELEDEVGPMDNSPKRPLSARKPPRKKKKKKKKKPSLTPKQRAAAEEKLLQLCRTLDPQPFLPHPATPLPDGTLLRLLGLHDFATRALDRDIRKDLLVELIAFYDRTQRRSFIKGARISVSRADLARSLGLPMKKAGPLEVAEEERRLLVEQAPAVVNFLMNWIVLVGEIGIIPDEAQAAIKMIESGQAHKVDWAALVMLMVDRELMEAPKSGFCYYASHLQQLIRHQKPNLFEVEEVEEDEAVMEIHEVEVEEKGFTTRCALDFDEHKIQNLEDPKAKKEESISFGLELGVGGDENAEDVRSQEQQQQHRHEQLWFLDGNDGVEGHILQRCSSNIAQTQSMDLDGATDEGHITENRKECEDDFISKFPMNLGGSNNFLQGISTGNDSFCPPIQPTVAPSGEFLVSPMGAHRSMSLDICPDDSLFGNNGKRISEEINDDGDEEEDDEGDEEGIRQFSHEYPSKRVRLDGEWSHGQSEFQTYVDEAMTWMGKTKEIYRHKEQEFMDVQMQAQYLEQLVHQKDQYIQTLERNKVETEHQKQLEICQFEHERTVMANMVIGYQKALKETHRAFAEYRKQIGQGVEPLYKDVLGGCGLVLPSRELERHRIEKLELEKHSLEMSALENELVIKAVLNFSREWSDKFEGYVEQVYQLARRLEVLHGEIKFLKGQIAHKKCSSNMVEEGVDNALLVK